MNWLSQNLIWIVLVGLAAVFLWRNQAMRSRGGGSTDMMHGASDADSDPVTGNRVDPAHAITANFEGKTFFFESEQSRAVFQQNPSRFLHRRHRHHGGCC